MTVRDDLLLRIDGANQESSSFHTGNPEGIHQLMHLFSDRGTPASLRHINAYSGHTYKFTKEVLNPGSP